ncbi:MAG TPA: hypothetical protein QGH10_12505 [Armatimonadota bacterium]|nr:hypothetical protein [Armatimonadota bacterium]
MMTNELPQNPRKIRERLRRYERKLREEKRTYGFHRDGAGKRYLVGPLYLLLGDVDGAFKAFRLFETEFPDDSGEPGHCLCWALALYRSGDLEPATRKLRETMLQNPYVVPHLLGLEVRELDIWHGSSHEWPSYLECIPADYFLLWDERELDWASRLYHGPDFQSVLARYVQIHKELKHLPPGPRRSRLVHEAYALKR